MRLLLDTHAFIWFVTNDLALNPSIKLQIENTTNELYLSIGSVWEMAIKTSIGKLNLRKPFEDFINEQLNSNKY